jgi:hypothetical protein
MAVPQQLPRPTHDHKDRTSRRASAPREVDVRIDHDEVVRHSDTLKMMKTIADHARRRLLHKSSR